MHVDRVETIGGDQMLSRTDCDIWTDGIVSTDHGGPIYVAVGAAVQSDQSISTVARQSVARQMIRSIGQQIARKQIGRINLIDLSDRIQRTQRIQMSKLIKVVLQIVVIVVRVAVAGSRGVGGGVVQHLAAVTAGTGRSRSGTSGGIAVGIIGTVGASQRKETNIGETGSHRSCSSSRC